MENSSVVEESEERYRVRAENRGNFDQVAEPYM